MGEYLPETRAEFLHRSYTAVDGLWFMMVEDDHGYEAALDLDRRVWAVMPKIQARKARELLDVRGNSPEDLARCFGLKFHAEGHDFEVEVSHGSVTFRVRQCHWLELLKHSDRQELADEIGQTICNTEGQIWTEEFGARYSFELRHRMCAGDDCCEYCFVRRTENASRTQQ